MSEMFEERATGKYIMTHIFCDGEEMSPSEVVELLNTLHQQNQELKFQLEECTNNKLYSRRKLEEENEQLRQSIDSMISKATEISNRNVLLHEEIGRQTRLNKELQQKLDWICEQTGYDGAKFKHIEELKEKIREKEEDEQLYANEIVKLNKEVKDNQFLRLGND